ncbi:MAG: rhodanese-like domain-containing protein [Streptococcaceae bacterium]|jgi:rhodanese-related sulfurtransferase|nr:rhodanese-like domain-containing protein [Streptococcaceae bacterium]
MVLNIILLVILLALIGQSLYTFVRIKKAATVIDNEEFKQKMRSGQVLDVREKVEFDASHIMGARSFPIQTLKQSGDGFGTGTDILIYDNRRQQAGRAALILKKKGYENIYLLKNGFSGWDGKVKAKKQ